MRKYTKLEPNQRGKLTKTEIKQEKNKDLEKSKGQRDRSETLTLELGIINGWR